MRSRIAQGCFGAWMAGLTAVYYAWPQQHLITWAAIGLSGAVAVPVGVRLHRPARRMPWLLLCAALLAFTAGDTTYNVVVEWLGQSNPFPGPADLLYLVVYPLLAGALLTFIRIRAGERDRAALIDSLVLTTGVGLLSWVFLIAPYVRAVDLSILEKTVSVGYPLGDLLALAMLLRLLTAPGRKPVAATILVAGVVALLVTDAAYGLRQLAGTWAVGGPTDLGWVCCYAAIGFCALHPSMTKLTDLVDDDSEKVDSGNRRLAVLGVAALVAPAVLLYEDLRGTVQDAPIIAALGAIMFVLVLTRVGGLITHQRQAGARERALREAGAMLASAATEHDVLRTVRDAVAALLPADKPYQFTVAGAEELDNVVRLVPVGELADDVPVNGFEFALRAGVLLPGSPPRAAAVFLTAAPETLRALVPSFEALFAQIAVVCERISLTGEVNRRDSEAYFRTLIQSASDVIMIIGDDDLIRYASPSAATIFGRSELPGTPLDSLIADTHHDTLHDVLARARREPGQLEGVDLSAVCADRRLLQVECSCRDLRDDPTVAGLVFTLRDVTERRRLEDDLAHQAFHDELTGLANRVLFRDRLERSFELAEREDTSLGVLLLDLDDFKQVNDTLGHAGGDQLLIAVGQRIAHCIGPRNTAARMDGDEFAVLVEPTADRSAAAEELAVLLVAALARPVEVSDGLGGAHLVSGAASVGAATSRDAESATELLRHADLALSLAKGAGKGTWQLYRTDLHLAMVERLETRAALHEAVDTEQFVLQYQPIVELPTATMVGVEALVRWQHPVRGLLAPFHFIDLAEENGAILGIGSWVLSEALRQLAQWRAARPGATLGYVSVNVSARQFRTPGFVDQVHAALAETDSRPEWLLLEITESLVLRDADQVWADLRTLREVGVRIAIDDFGTGYSSLSYLRQMPVDVLKIDKSFVDDILGSLQQRALVSAIVTLAGNLELTVVAEGIEHPAQRGLLTEMACPYGQGYLFSRPVWPAQISALLAEADSAKLSAGPLLGKAASSAVAPERLR